jgi:hypothetical protein
MNIRLFPDQFLQRDECLGLFKPGHGQTRLDMVLSVSPFADSLSGGADIHLVFLHLGCAFICRNFMVRVFC